MNARDPYEERRAAGVVVWAALSLLVLAVLLAHACGVQDLGGGAGFNFFGLTGEVFLCDQAEAPADDPGVEWCTHDDAEMLAYELDDRVGGSWSCRPTPRHLGPCLYGCAPHRGCNAVPPGGCWCPEATAP